MRKTSFLERTALAATPYDRVRRFLAETIWQWDPNSFKHFYERWAILGLRIVYLVGRGLVSSTTQLRASALTYTTMLALVPAFAVVFSLFQVFGGLEGTDDKVKGFLVRMLAPSPEQEAQIRPKLDDLVHNAHDYVKSGSGIAVLSLIFLILTVLTLLSTVEQTLNDVWGIKRTRSVLQKFMTYWALATLGPILLGLGLVMGSNINSRLGDYAPARLLTKVQQEEALTIEELQREIASGNVALRKTQIDNGVLGQTWTDQEKARFILFGKYPEEDASSRLTSFVMVVVAFTLLYAFMPNTRVHMKPAIIAAVMASLAWGGSRWALANLSSSLVQYNTIYGGLATIPIMMFWLYISWLIVIIGAELTFALQNIGTQGKEELAQDASPRCRETVALRITAAIADAFEKGADPPTLTQLSKRLGAPVTLVSAIIFRLCEDALLREIERADEDPGYVPARPLDRISLSDVLKSLHERSGTDFTLEGGDDAAYIAREMDRARAAHEHVSAKVTFDRVVRALRAGGQIVESLPTPVAVPAPAPAPGPAPAPAHVPGPDTRAHARQFIALKVAEQAKAPEPPASPSPPVGAGESIELAALLEGASPDDPST
ncbi:MAG TPA: YhjD/YihY/BrkB family envelope integrity protein [Planctomycetota bacterium]|nr:YhjD/YihY/BrkB family envelope integrity protein [Planctomycetota bacterium]